MELTDRVKALTQENCQLKQILKEYEDKVSILMTESVLLSFLQALQDYCQTPIGHNFGLF